MNREDSEDPHNSKADRSDNRQDHRHTGASHSTQCSRKQIHLSAEEISNCGIGKDLHSALDNLRIFRIDFQKLRAKEICSTSHGKGHHKGQDQTIHQHPVHTFRFPNTVILAGKTHTCLGNRIHGHIQKSKNIIGCCISCHSNGTKGVYRRLKKYIGKIDHCTLNPGRQSHLEDLLQVLSLYGQF